MNCLKEWFWFNPRRYFGGFVIGFYKIFSIWFSKDGLEFTIAVPSHKRIMLWWRKFDVEWWPITIRIYRR